MRTPGRAAAAGSGFTLIEIAVVIGIIALIIGALLPLIAAQSANGRISATRTREDTIRAAMTSFLGQHGHLPCPADGFALPGTPAYGHEARATAATGTGACTLTSTSGSVNSTLTASVTAQNASVDQVTTLRGVVPWLDLGLAEDVVNDGWNRRITYVTTDLSTQPFATREAASGLLGGLLVCNDLGSSATLLAPAIIGSAACSNPATAVPVADTRSAALALISHGENGYGAFLAPQGPTAPAGGMVRPYGAASAVERANIELGSHVLVQGNYSRNNDDLVLWVTATELVAPLTRSGALPAFQAVAMQKLQQARSQVLGAMVAARTTITDSRTCQSAYAYTLSLDMPCLNSGVFCQSPLSSPTPLLGEALPARTDPATTLTWAYAADANGSSGAVALNATRRLGDDATRPGFDPWGNPLLFSMMNSNTGASVRYSASEPTAAAGVPYAFLIYSAGPDGVLGTSDDLSLVVSSPELQAALATYGPLAANSVPGSCAH